MNGFRGVKCYANASLAAISFSNVSTSATPASTAGFLNYNFDGPDPDNPFDDAGQANVSFSDLSYRRSPQCTSDYYSYSSAHPRVTVTIPGTTETVTARYTGSTSTETDTLTETDPAFTYSGAPVLGCCGKGCAIYYNSVSVKYWPVPNANTDCLNSQISSATGSVSGAVSASTTSAPTPSAISSFQQESNQTLGITVGPDGFT